MNPFYAVLLGIIQGLTEFLPVSSTAHLTIAGRVLGLIHPEHPEAWTAFIAVMQLGTMAAVIGYFLKETASMLRSLLNDLRDRGIDLSLTGYARESRLAVYIGVGTLPVVTIGYALHKLIEGHLTKNLEVIGVSLVGLAALLWLAERLARHVRTLDQVTGWDALIVGLAQALALIPGSSRSGTTITAGLFLGLTREAAAKFSFLLSIPAVLLSGIYEMLKIDSSVFQLGVGNLVIATLTSAFSGYAAIYWLLRYLQRHSTMVFVWYRFAIGGLILLLLGLGVLQR